MVKNITRTIKTTTAFIAEVRVTDIDSAKLYDLPAIDFLGEVSQEKALAEAKKIYSDVTIILKDISVKESVYEMPVDQFMKLAAVREKENN